MKFVVNDSDGALRRVQVKTANAKDDGDEGRCRAQYSLSRRQLVEQKATPLYFMFLARWREAWSFLLLSRDTLDELRAENPRLKPDHEAAGDDINIEIVWTTTEALVLGDLLPRERMARHLRDLHAGDGLHEPRSRSLTASRNLISPHSPRRSGARPVSSCAMSPRVDP